MGQIVCLSRNFFFFIFPFFPFDDGNYRKSTIECEKNRVIVNHESTSAPPTRDGNRKNIWTYLILFPQYKYLSADKILIFVASAHSMVEKSGNGFKRRKLRNHQWFAPSRRIQPIFPKPYFRLAKPHTKKPYQTETYWWLWPGFKELAVGPPPRLRLLYFLFFYLLFFTLFSALPKKTGSADGASSSKDWKNCEFHFGVSK